MCLYAQYLTVPLLDGSSSGFIVNITDLNNHVSSCSRCRAADGHKIAIDVHSPKLTPVHKTVQVATSCRSPYSLQQPSVAFERMLTSLDEWLPATALPGVSGPINCSHVSWQHHSERRNLVCKEALRVNEVVQVCRILHASTCAVFCMQALVTALVVVRMYRLQYQTVSRLTAPLFN